MKISKIEVKKLFGVFDHEIPLTNDNNITIVIGENGLGKTVILEAMNAFFDGNYDFFNNLEFETFIFYFNNNDVWKLKKQINEHLCDLYIAKTSVEKMSVKSKEHLISSEILPNSKRESLRERELRRRSRENMYGIENYNILFDDHEYHEHNRMMKMTHNYQRSLDLQYQSQQVKKISPPKWFVDGVDKINIKLIETQRIITIKERGSDSYINNVAKCSQELRQIILKSIKKSSEVTSGLDSSYPTRLVRKLKQGTKDSFEELNLALAKLDKRRKLFSSVGLVVDAQDSELLQIDEDQKDLINLLKLYIDDSHKKLDPYEDLFQKIMLFTQIINKRFKHKDLNIQKDKGLVFVSTVTKRRNDKIEEIPASKLSSGEQNELILFYELIFNSQIGDMILIDEPELSLHISWQNKFIDDLKSVTSINDVSIIIATHSPDIISENWDLKVELLGVE